MAGIVAEAASICAPIAGRVIVLSVTDTAARFAVPDSCYGRFMTMVMDGSDADVVFGSSSVSCTYGQASSVSSEAITISAASGGHLKDGVAVPSRFPIKEKATHFSVDCKGSGSGKLYIYVG
jgi:hypothetical protein